MVNAYATVVARQAPGGGNNNGGNNNAGGGNGAAASPTPAPNPQQSQSASASTSSTSSISIPDSVPAGGILMIDPPNTASQSFYKIHPSEYITFRWNLTSLVVTPTSLTVIASCAANGNTYPVGPTDGTQNTIKGDSTQVVWNPYQWAQVPGQPAFAVATYQLEIYDEGGPGARARPGRFSPYTGTKFGMYLPQSPVPLDQWTCTTCSGAIRALGEPAGLSIFMSLLIVLITTFGMLRR
ncbi:uncharacterized protein LOC62_03G005099 [Vanrija pseudolonga]|uniref:DUF7137 domain-containing protein n=1 Tax=Vanrija pseudolonga TaxID=143232 RepID=A0AAF0Y7Z5_9TREE|nr:hypothetical protein LOC62_03G005099 [Vanrija pseudolonga]